MGKYRRRSDNYFHDYANLACQICNWSNALGIPMYVLFIGIVGSMITLFDLMTILKQNGLTDLQKSIKMMTSILSIEHFMYLLIGALMEYPIMLMPWLLIQGCIILFDLLTFFVRVFLEGLHLSRDEVVVALFTLYNWCQVFCLYHHQSKLTGLP